MKSNSGTRLHMLAEYYGITQTDIAAKTNIPKSALSMYFSGKRNPKRDRLKVIADTYEVNEAWLLGYDVPMLKSEKENSPELTGYEIGKLLSCNSEQFTKLLEIYTELDKESKDAWMLIGEKMLKIQKEKTI